MTRPDSSPPEPPDFRHLLRHLPSTPAPGGLFDEVQAALRRPPARPPVLRRPVRSPLVAAAAVVLALAGGMYGGLLVTYRAPARWEVVPLAGLPRVGTAALRDPGDLETGEWLTTDAQSQAELAVGRIGTVVVGPNSRLRLEPGRGPTSHRLTLERGALDAVIAAPPRLFFVETPSALATDLGCAYTLDVDSSGTSRLHVTSGWVELREAGRVSLVAAGLVAEVEAGRPPGTPYPYGFSDEARSALRRLDTGGGDTTDLRLIGQSLAAPDALLRRRQESGVTLWHLVQRLDGVLRARAYDQLAALVPPPPKVTREGILSLDRRMLERWRRELHPMWSEEAQPLLVRIARRLWDWTM